MLLKTINKAIKAKLNEWLMTITDEQLRGKVNKSLLVSGGSITSMLLNEPVNDFDIYIQDRAVLMELAAYYIKQFPDKIRLLDGKLRQSYIDGLPEYFNNEDEKEGVNNSAFAVSVRNLKDDQVKLFFESKNGGERVNEDKKPEELNYTPVFFSPNAISLSNNIQIVLRFHGTPDEIHQTFDFIHPTNYFTFDTGVVTNKEALLCIIEKSLKYQGSQYPLTSIIRMKKFIKRGWSINAGEILKIMFQVSELDLTDPDVLEEQLIGVDIAYFATLISVLRGVERSKITSEYINTIIDRVFNNHEEIEE